MSESWDDYADDWDTNQDVITYSEKAYDSLCQLISLDGLRVLDFGCGTGLLTEPISRKAEAVVGLDSSEKMIEVLQRKQLPGVDAFAVELSAQEVASNPHLHSKFDLIVASSVCAFLPNYEDTLLLLKSMLTPDGLFVQWDWCQSEAEPDFGFTEEMISMAYGKAGLDVIKIDRAFALEGKDRTMWVIMGVGKVIA